MSDFNATFQPGLGGLAVLPELHDAIQQYQEQEKLGAYNDQIVQQAAALGKITPQELADYHGMSSKQKQGFAAGKAATMLDDMKRQQQQSEQKLQSAQIANLTNEIQQRQGAKDFRPNSFQITGPEPGAKPTTVWQMQQGAKWQTADELSGGGDSPTIIDPYTDPTTRQPIAGRGVVRKTGQVIVTAPDANLPAPDPFGRYFNGKSWVQIHKDKVDPATAVMTSMRQSQAADLAQQIAIQQNKLDSGDTHEGGVLGIGSTPRAQIVAGLKARLSALLPPDETGTAPAALQPVAAPAPTAPPAAPTQTKVRVKAPDGTVGYIPQEQLQSALSQGYTPAQ